MGVIAEPVFRNSVSPVVSSATLNWPTGGSGTSMQVKPTHASIIKYNSDVYPLLTEEKDAVIREMGNVVFEYTCKMFGGTIPQIEVTGFTDPEENTDYISVVVDVPLDAQRALDFWDELGDEVERWVSTLPPDKAQIAQKQITTRVRWN